MGGGCPHEQVTGHHSLPRPGAVPPSTTSKMKVVRVPRKNLASWAGAGRRGREKTIPNLSGRLQKTGKDAEEDVKFEEDSSFKLTCCYGSLSCASLFEFHIHTFHSIDILSKVISNLSLTFSITLLK